METSITTTPEEELEELIDYTLTYSSETESTTFSDNFTTSLDDISETVSISVSAPQTGDPELLQSVKSIDYNLSVLTGLSIIIIVVLLCNVIIKTFFR